MRACAKGLGGKWWKISWILQTPCEIEREVEQSRGFCFIRTIYTMFQKTVTSSIIHSFYSKY